MKIITLTPQSKVILTKDPDNTDSIIYAISKKLKNNACKIASVKYSTGENIDVLVMNNLIIKDRRGRHIVNTESEKINQNVPVKKYLEYFRSAKYIVESQPVVILNLNQDGIIISFPLSDLLLIKYKKKAIKEFVTTELKKFKSMQKSLQITG